MAELTPADVGIWTLAGSWCSDYLTDGEITLAAVRRLGGTQENAESLVDSGLWAETTPGTYQFKDWTDYQPTRAAVEADREAARERMRGVRAKGGKRSGDVRANNSRSSINPAPAPVVLTELGGVGDSSENPAPEAEKATRRKPSLPIPSKWQPTPAHVAYATEHHLNLEAEATSFRGHAETYDRRCASWNAAFSTWLRKAKPTISNHNALWD